ncbi:tetratricopeptide repeat protein [Flavobacterium sp. RS13.1]|uniref:tetratricopeptide repeat protein n=1 Tax=Flavobacterium sp. RS13.1 TaxID=3400345 RepID=UPI003AABA247
MNVTNYTYLINKPDAITEKQTEALGSVLIEFPYFQSARALRLKGLYNQNSFKYNHALKVTAAHTSDRSVLFDFITSETFNSIQGEFYDRKLRDLLNITVFDSEIVLAEEKKKKAELRIDLVEKSILDSIKEATTITTFEEPAKVEEKGIESVSEQSILDSFEEVTNIAFKEPEKTEKKSIEAVSEQLILDSFKEVTNSSLEESVKIEDNPIDSVIELPTLDSFKEVAPTIEEKPIIDPIPVKKEGIRTFFEEIVEEEISEEIPEIRVEPIEKSTYDSLLKATKAIFDEVPAEEPKETEVYETVKTAKENLEIGKPLDFSISEKHSFQEWLQLARPEPIDRTNEGPKEAEKTEKNVENIVENQMIDEEKKKKAEIIDKFIETNPKISPIKQTAINPAVQLDSNKEDNSYLMTETLARVYLEQKKYTKAIQAYEILILKYPEKITFFADRISDIKILQQNNNNNN